MAVLVVSPSSSLTVGLGARLTTVGVGPDDLERWLPTGPPLTGAVIDDALGTDVALASARLVRRSDTACPILLVVSAGVSPDRGLVSDLEPVRLVRRPFTAAQLTAELEELSSQMLEGQPEPPAHVGPAVEPTPPPHEPSEIVPKASDERLSQGPATTGTPSASVTAALATILTAPLVSLPEALASVLDALEAAFSEETAMALMIEGPQGWEVAGGKGLRSNERRVILAPSHWLSRKVAGGEVAVVVNGTDIARQELQSVPLIALEYWMATSLPRTPLMVLLARSDGPPFTVADAMLARRATEPLADQVNEALLTREVARRLESYRV
jgi:hypothetical protein